MAEKENLEKKQEKQEKKTVAPVITDEMKEASLLAKIKKVREAQKIFASYTQEQVDKIFYAAAYLLQRWLLQKQEWALSKTRLSRTTMHLNISTINTSTQ